ncbi:Gfo/Idh/MocA family oxidoreductase [Acerihabitans sp. TG2]|uniref:Gfo/Idh/MocA family protein n=1 Tax=Acerihabitans sp. TG2 TaxID=3096008 RepID=UPI002B22DAA2|nr:Gfo/Idh/MocA family oxidoreductase [Acerihabitans sp. TG2]MEA9390567.1 Gfo/Idh/MocA family oxidoreductase [Acerihabitans sp. TG2]
MKYVIVGTGNISHTYLQALQALPASEAVGFISRSKTTEATPGALPYWPTLAAVDRPYDAVIVTTPNGLHHHSAIEAARLGKHILVEKPLDISQAAMDAMISAAQQHHVTLAVSYQRRTNPDNQAIKALLEQNAFGRIYAADLSCRFWRDEAYYASADYRGGYAIDGGGVFMQQASHNIDNYVWLFGLPESLQGELDTFAHQIEAEDHGAVVLRYANGMIGTLVASTCARPGYPPRLEVSSEKGTFTLLNDCISEWYIDGIDNPASSVPPAPDGGASTPNVSDSSRHEAIITDFEQAINQGTTPLADGSDARRATELILRIYHCRAREV